METTVERIARIKGYVATIRKYQDVRDNAKDADTRDKAVWMLNVLKNQYGHMVPSDVWN